MSGPQSTDALISQEGARTPGPSIRPRPGDRGERCLWVRTQFEACLCVAQKLSLLTWKSRCKECLSPHPPTGDRRCSVPSLVFGEAQPGRQTDPPGLHALEPRPLVVLSPNICQEHAPRGQATIPGSHPVSGDGPGSPLPPPTTRPLHSPPLSTSWPSRCLHAPSRGGNLTTSPECGLHTPVQFETESDSLPGPRGRAGKGQQSH